MSGDSGNIYGPKKRSHVLIQHKSKASIRRNYVLGTMAPLIGKRVTVNGNGHLMSVGFTKYGNRHLYSDVNIKKRTRKIKDSDLPIMDKTLSQAKFIRKAGLYKPRKDKIKRFYYYEGKIRKTKIYLHVAEMEKKNNKGKLKRSRFLYSVTDKI